MKPEHERSGGSQLKFGKLAMRRLDTYTWEALRSSQELVRGDWATGRLGDWATRLLRDYLTDPWPLQSFTKDWQIDRLLITYTSQPTRLQVHEGRPLRSTVPIGNILLPSHLFPASRPCFFLLIVQSRSPLPLLGAEGMARCPYARLQSTEGTFCEH